MAGVCLFVALKEVQRLAGAVNTGMAAKCEQIEVVMVSTVKPV